VFISQIETLEPTHTPVIRLASTPNTNDGGRENIPPERRFTRLGYVKCDRRSSMRHRGQFELKQQNITKESKCSRENITKERERVVKLKDVFDQQRRCGYFFDGGIQ
jgi:hypothetical protein